MITGSQFKNRNGFSLVELMVVVAIIGVLASVAVPNYQRFAGKAKQAEAKTSLSALYTAEKAFTSEWGAYCADFRNIGYQPVGTIRYRHGFGAAGNNVPAAYSGAGVAANGTPVNFNTSVAAVCTGWCSELTSPINPGSLTASNVTTSAAFTAEARGDLDGDSTIDVWTMDHNKALAFTGDDLGG